MKPGATVVVDGADGEGRVKFIGIVVVGLAVAVLEVVLVDGFLRGGLASALRRTVFRNLAKTRTRRYWRSGGKRRRGINDLCKGRGWWERRAQR